MDFTHFPFFLLLQHQTIPSINFEFLTFIVIEAITLLICIYLLIKNLKLQKKINEQVISSSEQKIEGFLNHIHHLNNVIGGINHEIQPLVGIINTKLALVERKLQHITSDHQNDSVLCYRKDYEFCNQKIRETQAVIKTMLNTLQNLSKDIKSIQEYNLVCSNLGHSVVSWVYVVLNDLELKNFIKHKNIFVDEESLNFNCWHSPMFVSQIILNLIKNSIEHNPDKEDLYITIFGDKKTTSLMYCDNGKGIPKTILNKIFTPGFTTKNNSPAISGLGLSLCKEYCETMKASIKAIECETGAKFLIEFQPCSNKKDVDSDSYIRIKKQHK